MEKEIHEMLYNQLKGNIRKITVGEIETFLNNYARVVISTAQNRVRWMAFAAGGAGFTLGLFIGWILWSA